MSEKNLDKIIFLYKEIEIIEPEIKQNLEILKEIYKTIGKNLEEINTEKTNIHKFFIEKITEITKEILNNLSHEEKIKFEQYIPNTVRICLLSDDEKIRKVEDNEVDLFNYELRLISESLKYTDEEKLELVKKIRNDETFGVYIASTIQDDNIKMELIKSDFYLFTRYKIPIIESLKLDSNKLEALKFIIDEDQEYATIIICGLEDDNRKIEMLNRITYEDNKVYIIKSIKDDGKKLECLKYISQEKWKVEIIISLQNNKNKISVLDKIQDEKSRFEIIRTIRDDKSLIEAISYLSEEQYKTRIIVRFESDDEKIKFLKGIKDDDNKITIINSLQSDDKKIELLDEILDENLKVKIIENLEDDDKKIELLDEILDENLKVKIIENLEDDDKKIAQLVNFSYEEYRIRIIRSLDSSDKKISFLENFKDENSKIKIIETISDLDKRIEALSYLESESAKLEVINKIYDKEKKLKALGTINEKYKRIYELIYGKDEENINGKYTAFGLPKEMTIGIEIESVGEKNNLLPDYLRNWEGKKDNSLGNKGKEYTSPIMHDRKKDVQEIYRVNEILKLFGMEATPNCGAHVHIGADYIKTEEGFKQLVELWGNAEEIYYLISNKPGELPRKGIEQFAKPISYELGDRELDKIPKDRFILVAKRIFGRCRHRSLNLMSVNNARNTIEFRLSNGTLDGNTWIENIRLYGRTVEIAEKLGLILKKLENEEELSKEEKELYGLKERLKQEIPLDEKMDILMEILFDEEERKVYRKRYTANKSLDEKEEIVSNMEFKKVDFKKIYKSVEIPEGIIENMQEESRMETEGENSR